jgi:hypothetical protein
MFFSKRKIIYIVIITSLFYCSSFNVNAQTINIDASKLLTHAGVSFSPRSGSFEEGSTFQVPILINTNNRSINGIEIRVNFDRNKLFIVNPISGTSIIGVWVEAPKYDNTQGTASYVGVIPGGITTGSGLIGAITFKAKAPGKAVVSIDNRSKILLNDGLGTETILDAGRAEYSIFPKAPEGVEIFSETHPIQSNWYNNNSPVISWVKDLNISGFSFVLDNKPNTIPENNIMTEDNTKSFASLNDGLWYFHVKAVKNNAWSTTGHFLVRIDTAPPAKFKPNVDFLVASNDSKERTLVSFFTTDNLSGIDHYEVGIIDKSQPLTESPTFIQTESPFQIPIQDNGKLQVIVRAVDKAGNVRDESIDVHKPSTLIKFLQEYPVYILIAIILIGMMGMVMHYLLGHHILRSFRRVRQMLNKEEREEEKYIEAAENVIDKEIKDLVQKDEIPIITNPTPEARPEIPVPQKTQNTQPKVDNENREVIE